eukprot:403375911
MVDTSKPTFGYWKIRGLAQQIRYIFEYLKVPYNDVQYEQGEGPEFNVECWTSVKHTLGLDFPNLPYLIDGDVKITESQAILRYVLNKYGQKLLGKSPEDQAKADQLYFILTDIKQFGTGHCYSTGDRELVSKKSIESLSRVNDYMEGKSFGVGDYITYVDFQFLETLDFVNWISNGEVYEKYPRLQEYFNRVSEIPEIKEYVQSDRFLKKPFNNKVAKLNNWDQ